MTDFIKENIYETIEIVKCRIQELNLEESNLFRKKFQEKFTEGHGYFPVWENIFPRYSVRQQDAWEWLDEFIQRKETYILFDKCEQPNVFLFEENQSLVQFLAEFPDYICYFTNKNLDYVLCQNDSDYLIASGTAIDWLRQKVLILTSQGWQDLDKRSKPEEFE